MASVRKILFKRGTQKGKKKLSESLASLDNLKTQVEETSRYGDQLHLQREETLKRLQNASEKKEDLSKRIKEKSVKLARITDKIDQASEASSKLREEYSRNEEICHQLELLHKELPTRMWTLQVKLSRAFRTIEETKRNISTVFSNHNRCREKVENKKEEILRKQIQIKSTKEKISAMKIQLQKAYDAKKVKEFQQKSLESMVVYAMNMNIRAVNSRSKMIERRSQHLENMLENMHSELRQYKSLHDIKMASTRKISDEKTLKRSKSLPQRLNKYADLSVALGDL